MAWKISIGDKSMMLDDLSADDFAVIATLHGNETNWLRLYQAPASHPGAFYDLLVRCAVHMEVPAPDRPVNVAQAVGLLKHLDAVDEDDLPKEFTDQGLPLDTADEEATGTSPTSTAPEGGTPSELEAQA